jgi:hypothetical protein
MVCAVVRVVAVAVAFVRGGGMLAAPLCSDRPDRLVSSHVFQAGT